MHVTSTTPRFAHVTRSRPRRFVRAVSFAQAPSAPHPVPVVFAPAQHAPDVQSVAPLPGASSSGDVTIEALGSPPMAVSVAAPPSLPVYIRRNSLLALQAGPSSVRFAARLFSPLYRFVYGNIASRYQEVVGTAPFRMLVSANAPSWVPRLFARTTPKSFCNVALDGRSDWAVLKRDALQVYAGPSLQVAPYAVPARISRRFSQQLGLAARAKTGLFRWAAAGYTFVHGRGVLGLVGNGVVYAAQIAEGETIAVSRPHLLAVAVNGPHDLQNCVVAHSNPVNIDNVTVVPPPRVAQVRSARDAWVQLKFYYWRVWDAARKARGYAAQHAIGNQDFVRVVGPRTVLLQSGVPQESFERKFHLPRLAPASHVETTPAKRIEQIPADYLNVVTVHPEGGATIESTDNFKDGLRVKQK